MLPNNSVDSNLLAPAFNPDRVALVPLYMASHPSKEECSYSLL